MLIVNLNTLSELEFDKILDMVEGASAPISSIVKTHEYSKEASQLTDKLHDGTTIKVIRDES